MSDDLQEDLKTESIEAIKLWLEQLSSEYKILQDKIDKIGGFKFTIRGWSVTIVVASCIGATTARLPSPFLLLGLIFFVAIFGYLEHIQSGYRETFERRCAEIERSIWRLLRKHGSPVPGMVPRIAHELARENRRAHRWIRAIRAHDEYAFCVVLSVIIVGLTLWLAGHPRVPDPAESPHEIQYNIMSDQPARVTQSAAKSANRNESDHNAQSKKTSTKKSH